jgi:hypothetical protein
MKVAAVAALSVLIILPAQAGQRHRQNGSQVATCDNNGHCTTLNATAPTPSYSKSRSEIKRTIATARRRSPAVDANGNPAGIVKSDKTGARARVGIAYAARFQAYIDDLESNYNARVLFMRGIRPGRCSTSSEHPCGKALDVCQLRRGIVDPRCHLPGRGVPSDMSSSLPRHLTTSRRAVSPKTFTSNWRVELVAVSPSRGLDKTGRSMSHN